MTDSTTETLLFQLHRCASLLHRGRHHFTDEEGLARHGQGRVLALLARLDGASQRDVSEILGIRPASVSELMEKLDRAGLVRRQPSSQDRRLLELHLTPEGREQVNGMRQARQALADRFFAGLREEEREQLSTLLDKLIASLEAVFGEDEPSGEHGGRHGRHGHGPHGGRMGHGRSPGERGSREGRRPGTRPDREPAAGFGPGPDSTDDQD